jgi:RHS repeat-associated protein
MSSRERRYDGGMLRTLSLLWNADDRLRVVNEGSTNRITASYDGDGVRASKTENWPGAALAHNYSWGPDGLLYDSNANTIYTPGFGQQASGVDRYADQDWLGSTRYLSDGQNGNGFPSMLRFDAFGNRSATGGTDAYDSTDLQFAGGLGYQTEFASATEPGVGLQYLDQRHYDPAVGRFISQDPLGLSDYGYAGNDPVNAVDPSGLYSFNEWKSDFLRGSVVVHDWAYEHRYGLGLTAGVAGLLLPGGGLVEGALLGGTFTAGFSASGGSAPLDVPS